MGTRHPVAGVVQVQVVHGVDVRFDGALVRQVQIVERRRLTQLEWYRRVFRSGVDDPRGLVEEARNGNWNLLDVDAHAIVVAEMITQRLVVRVEVNLSLQSSHDLRLPSTAR